MSELMPEKPEEKDSKAEVIFQIFCAVIFLSKIGRAHV